MPPTRTRKFELEIGSEAKGVGAGFDKAGKELDRFEKKMGAAGDRAGKQLSGGLEDGVNGVGSKLKSAGEKAGKALDAGVAKGAAGVGATLESAGSTASDALASGFDPSAIADLIGGKLSSLGSKGGKLMAGVAAVGVAAGAAFTVGLMQGMENEVSTDRLAAQLGGGAWAEEQGEIAANLYLDAWGDSIAETGEAVKLIHQNGLLPEDATSKQIENLGGLLLTFTDVLVQDMDMTTQAVSNMIRTGIADSSEEALDVMTRGIQQGADRAGDLAETFQEYSTLFRDAGLSAADATGLMVQGLKAGARDADTVADALKEFAIRAQDGSEASAEGFKLIGLNAKDMTDAVAAGGPVARDALDQVLDGLRAWEDPVARNAAAIALFGTKAEDLGDALFDLDLDTAAAGLGNVAGATDGLNSAYDNASTTIEEFKRERLADLTEFIGNAVIPAGQKLAKVFGDDLGRVFGKVAGFFKDNEGAMKALAVVSGVAAAAIVVHWAATAAAAVGAAVVHGVQVALMIGKYVLLGVAALASAAQMALAWIIALGPIALVIAGIAGLAALVVIHFDTITDAIKAAFGWVKTNWPTLLAILTGPIGLAVLAISRNWESIKAGATAVKDWIVARFNDVVSFVTGLPSRMAAAAGNMWGWIASTFKTAINGVIAIWNGFQLGPWTIDIGSVKVLGRTVFPGFHKTFGPFSPPNLPMLAEGGIVTRPTLAMIGEGRHDEAVIPLDGNRDLGGGDTYIFNLENHGVIGSREEFRRWLREEVSAGIASGQIHNRGRRLT